MKNEEFYMAHFEKIIVEARNVSFFFILHLSLNLRLRR